MEGANCVVEERKVHLRLGMWHFLGVECRVSEKFSDFGASLSHLQTEVKKVKIDSSA